MQEVLIATQELISKRIEFVLVTLVESSGSCPQDPGAKMIVTRQGHFKGTVGGGALEAKALHEAQQMLEQMKGTQLLKWSLKEIGMTCGGAATLFFEVFSQKSWQVVVFGGGHVAGVLVPLLCQLPCQVICFDPRKEWLDKIPDAANLQKKISEKMEKEVVALSDESFVVVMTRGHEQDYQVLKQALKHKKFSYLGVMGSRRKALELKKWLEKDKLKKYDKDFFCPIGLPIGTNHLHEIAISIIAQLIEQRDLQSKD